MDLRATLIIAVFLGVLGLVIVGLGTALPPLMIAFGLAYLLFPIIQKIETWGFKRHFTVIGVFVLWSILVILGFVGIVPDLIQDAQNLLQEFPAVIGKILERAEHIASDYGYVLTIGRSDIETFIMEHTSDISTTLFKGLSTAFRGIFANGLQVLLKFLNFFLVPLFFFYLINDFEKIIDGVKSMIPPSLRPKVSAYIDITNRVLSGYIRGQILVAIILAFLYGIGLSLVGIKFGFLVGFVSGLLSIIPYAGFSIGFAKSLIIGLAYEQGLSKLIGVVVVFTIVQALEGTVITPRLVGDKVGLSALTTILALIIGGNLFGLIGMLIAIPAAAVLKLALIEIKKEYQSLEFYQTKKED